MRSVLLEDSRWLLGFCSSFLGLIELIAAFTSFIKAGLALMALGAYSAV